MEFWNHIYEHFDPIAFTVFSLPVHWYGLMYVLALGSALYVAKGIVAYDKLPIKQRQLDDYFIYIEIGIILGARLGYILFYDPNTSYYLTQPWQIFNPFDTNGDFVGIRGMSYHGAVIGWFLGSLLYHKRHPDVSFGLIMDVVALAVPIGYIFGRIGNFMNQELIGRATDLPWGIYVNDVLCHPSQLYEAVLEGLVVFVVIYLYRNYKRFNGDLILVYGLVYGLMRFVAEFWREPDIQIGFLYGQWLTMGQALSTAMMVSSIVLWFYFNNKYSKV